MTAIKTGAILFMMVLTCSIGGCKPKYRQPEKPSTGSYPDQESIFRANQSAIKKNAQSIRDQAALKGWKLTETGTGVFYQIIGLKEGGHSIRILPGDRVSLSFRVSLLDGTECYSSEINGLKQFVVEKSEAEQGLHEVVQLLYPGDSALVILPPHRAFGFAGDGNRIPPSAVLVYEIRIDSVARHLTD